MKTPTPRIQVKLNRLLHGFKTTDDALVFLVHHVGFAVAELEKRGKLNRGEAMRAVEQYARAMKRAYVVAQPHRAVLEPGERDFKSEVLDSVGKKGA